MSEWVPVRRKTEWRKRKERYFVRRAGQRPSRYRKKNGRREYSQGVKRSEVMDRRSRESAGGIKGDKVSER